MHLRSRHEGLIERAQRKRRVDYWESNSLWVWTNAKWEIQENNWGIWKICRGFNKRQEGNWEGTAQAKSHLWKWINYHREAEKRSRTLRSKSRWNCNSISIAATRTIKSQLWTWSEAQTPGWFKITSKWWHQKSIFRAWRSLIRNQCPHPWSSKIRSVVGIFGGRKGDDSQGLTRWGRHRPSLLGLRSSSVWLAKKEAWRKTV